jgi:uncharacterized alpha-E superfamily protein
MADESIRGVRAEDHSSLSDEELRQRLRDHRRGSGEWAAVLAELQRRSDRIHSHESLRAALASAKDEPVPPEPPPA